MPRPVAISVLITACTGSAGQDLPPAMRFWDFHLNRPLPQGVFDSLECASGRTAMASPGRWDARPEAMFMRPLHEHVDTAAVATALDPIRVCYGRVPGLSSYVAAVEMHGRVVRLSFFWQDTSIGPPFDEFREILATDFGQPALSDSLVARWVTDSIIIDWMSGPCWMPGGQELHAVAVGALLDFESRVHGHHLSLDSIQAPTIVCTFGLPR